MAQLVHVSAPVGVAFKAQSGAVLCFSNKRVVHRMLHDASACRIAQESALRTWLYSICCLFGHLGRLHKLQHWHDTPKGLSRVVDVISVRHSLTLGVQVLASCELSPAGRTICTCGPVEACS